jgi:hypothetical protein
VRPTFRIGTISLVAYLFYQLQQLPRRVRVGEDYRVTGQKVWIQATDRVTLQWNLLVTSHSLSRPCLIDSGSLVPDTEYGT